MGFAFYYAVDRPAGYGVLATCDRRRCDAEINRGLGCLCGDNPEGHGRTTGCGMYFCGAHLGYVGERGGCRHRQGRAWGETLSCMAERVTYEPCMPGAVKRTDACLYRRDHDGGHAWEAGETA